MMLEILELVDSAIFVKNVAVADLAARKKGGVGSEVGLLA